MGEISVSATKRLDWLAGGGEMGRFIAAHDWSATHLGPIESWPQGLRTTVSLCLASNFPINIIWGDGHNQIYNDGYRVVCGDVHPRAMGEDYRVTWASAWPAIGQPFERALTGETTYLENQRMFLERNGYEEETFFTFSLSPIRNEAGKVVGLFHPVTETTSSILAERRVRALRDIADGAGRARVFDEACELLLAALETHVFDVPFALLYVTTSDCASARLRGVRGIQPGASFAADAVGLGDAGVRAVWPLEEAARGGRAHRVADVAARFGELVARVYPEPISTAFVLPLRSAGSDAPLAYLVVGASPRLPLDETYSGFVEMLGAAASAALGNARAYESERSRAEQLAELDRAKTAFFSNVSHELRTPLTLILGPLEDALGDSPRALRDESLESVHRNALRLLRLVNSLLDFSRVEAGRLESRYQATDLSVLTGGLAGSFQSLVESAGLKLRVDCPPLPEPVYVDRSQWEKIVLNLLSNAFKFTFAGEITVRLRAKDGHVELSVKDTGTGIPAEALPKIFDRFHRVDGARSRSFEGTGIGLALVRELVAQHGGAVRVESAVDQGTEFVVTIPMGSDHLAKERVSAAGDLVANAIGATPFLLEATQWAPEERRGPADEAPRSRSAARLLIADDNADMRAYLVKLLAPRWTVDAVGDGQAALESVLESPPDLLISDVMMPKMDGIALLRALRANPKTRTIPILLLSARAGEEALVSGLDTGADDYLVKPFSARELVTRIQTHLELARTRRAAESAATELAETRAALLADLERKNADLEAFSYSVSHDLRAPLRSVDGFSNALLEEHVHQLDATGQGYLRRVLEAAKRMNALIDDLIELSRVTNAELQLQAVDLTRVGARIARRLAMAYPTRDVAWTVDEGLVADVDPRLAEILLENLLGNAWKFTGKTPSPRVTLGAEERDGARVFSVKDNGAGFDEAYASRLFAPFQRLHSAAEFPGTGIGLATVRRIVERHGGRVWAEAKVGAGAAVYWTF
jgi:signal transduction histidine kinase